MKKNAVKKISLMVLVVFLLAIGAACSNGSSNGGSTEGETVKLVAATINPSDSLLAQTLTEFAREIERESNGEIEFTIHTGGTVGNASSLYQSVITGDIDIIYSDTGWFAEHNPIFGVLSTNYLFEDQEHFESIVNTKGSLSYFEDLLIESPGLKTIMFAGGLERNIISTFPIESAADLNSRTMRSGGSAAELEWWRLIGANPTSVDFSEVYSAIQTGVVSGSQNSLDAMIEQRFGEVAKYVARTQHNLTLGFIVMNNSRYDGLSDAHKQAIARAADKIQPEYISKAFEQADESMRILEEEFGVTFTNPDRTELIELSRTQMRQIAEDNGGLEIVEDIFN